MKIQDLCKLYNSPERGEAIKSLVTDKGVKIISVDGLVGSSVAMFISSMPKVKNPYIIITNNADDAGYMYHDLCKLNGEAKVLIFPSGYKRDIKYGQVDAPSEILRTETLNRLGNDKMVRWVVTYPEALAERVVAKEALDNNTLSMAVGASIEMGVIAKRLLGYGFVEVDYVYEPGQFSIRGSILDIFSFSNEMPYRVDFFGDDVESIRVFNVETQLSQDKIDKIYIVNNITSIKSENVSLLDYVSSASLLLCHDPNWLLARIEAIGSEVLSSNVILAGEGDKDAMGNVVDATAFKKRFNAMRRVDYGYNSVEVANSTLAFKCSPQGLFHKNFDLISESFKSYIDKGLKIYVLSDSILQTNRLKSIFDDRGDDIDFIAVEGTLHEGFVDYERGVCVFTDHQIFDRFHKYSLKSDKARSGKLALSIKELNQIEVGDYIVHVDHGVGKFGGLLRTDINGRMQEMIKLTYLNDDIIFVSIHSLHKLAKYRGKEGVEPRINKLGSGAWNRIKEKTKGKLKDIARDLIKLYSERRDQKGFAYSPDSYLQHELEASFIYEDTPDQLKATEDVKRDMESEQPMDRLICGDVGFGKTEVAIRAAFKAAVDGKQTAVLVPTTVLAYQHYNSFKNRLKELPVKVDYISRARKPKDVKRLLEELATGKIDILIGTHKMVGKDVKFHDLGLLVVDEEQKFGVSVKEKLKQMRVNVDTLTMSATPIPRTLQFSLMGARDLSSINTPPANRYPILTSVNPFDDEIIKEAISFELSRNGQVFLVNNRIEQLYDIESTIRRLVPDARVVIGHGQMPPEELERKIIDFSNQEYDILLSTTIIESGIDMPNVNTIIINNAQNFGLSELHQLRGRVGRSSRKAFCYLMIPPVKILSSDAQRRLQAIESFSELGSGIHIAMQDLDIRGAGNILGAEQSGFIADLGYETYQKILKEALFELRTEEFADTIEEDETGDKSYVSDCVIESDMELLLPSLYVPQEGERISLYQQLDSMETDAEVELFRKSLRDRFGAIPYEGEELIRIVPLRRLARYLGIEKLSLKQGIMYIYFVGDENKAYYQSSAFGRIVNYVAINNKRCQFREIREKRSVKISNVTSVQIALAVLTEINSLENI
ncbi:MAG: transcription-repair coupling factor [Bacteroidales bacterium]